MGNGGGKTTLASRLARLKGVPHIELDALNWEPGWQEAPLEVFRERVGGAVASEEWVVDGNYSKARDLIWPRAETVIWLDYPLRIVAWRTLARALRRIRSGEELWGTGNRETIRNIFFSRDSVLWWKIKSHHRRRKDYARLLADEWPQLDVVRLRSPVETEGWFRSLAAATDPDT